MSVEPASEQLTLLPAPTGGPSAEARTVPARLRLDAATRRRGLQHIAAIRLQLAERHADRPGAAGRTAA